jgi:integrase
MMGEMMGGRVGKTLLSALAVKRLPPGLHQDGGARGLYLQVAGTGARSWIFRYMLNGRRRDMGLGPADVVPLAEARIAAHDARKLLHQKVDPLARRDAERVAATEAATAVVWTFRKAAEAVHETLKPGWKNPKHADQWINTLTTYAYPTIADRPVAGVDVAAVVAVLKPIWTTKRETARRVRQRLDAVMTWAVAHGHATTNPVDAATALLPKVKKAVEHHKAVPAADAPGFWTALGKLAPHPAPLALRFAVLTAARSNEVRGATWAEIDTDAGIWTVPAARMKADREHVVPLSDAALAVLQVAEQTFGRAPDSLIFPGPRDGKPLSDNAFKALLDRMGVDATAHGFRSTFRDWCAEGGVPREVAERALAHAVGNAVEAAYNRTQLIEQRRPLMARWAAFLAGAK